MKSPHTPGPWTFSLKKSGDYQLRGSNEYLVMQISTGTIPGNCDAHLIASAPDLLRALERLAHPMADDDDLDYAREIIAKAKGKA
jgi:hypothetical protein